MVDTSAIRRELCKVLSSPIFANAPRMSRFLAFVVEETLAGNSERIKEYVIALEVFERDQNYDPHADSTVRTEASKLRTRLDRYYRTIGQADSVVISIPKGRYTPAFDHGSRQNLPFLAAASEPRNPMAAAPTASCRSTSTPPDLDEPCFNAFVRRPKRFRKFSFLRSIYFCVISAALITWLIGSVGRSVFRTASQPSDFHSSMPLTNYIGSEVCPSFAPDGERVAFAWNGDNQDNFDVYVKQIGVTVLLRLTYDPEPDISPAWSPDGRSIAFLHVVAADKAEVRLIPAIAPGLARKLATVTILPGSYFGFRSIAWSPDGKWLAISDGPKFAGVMSLFVLSMETGERQRVTFPPLDYDDLDPAFSPDMHRLAFVRYSSLGASASDLYSVDLSGALKPKGEPQRLTFDNRQTATPVWTPDGRAILFARSESPVVTAFGV
jgi:WD40-like Beta Propeller Repeat